MIELFKEIESGNLQTLKREKWLQYLILTKERRVNIERISSVEELKDNKALLYTYKTLQLLETLDLNCEDKYIVGTALKWCEVSKCGLPHKRAEWLEKGYNLFAHNLGSAEIFWEETQESNENTVIYTLIKTHGLIGQYLRGEVPMSRNEPLYDLIIEGRITKERLENILDALNYCIIGAVDNSLWELIGQDIKNIIKNIVKGNFSGQDIKARIKSLRQISAANGEDYITAYSKLGETELISIENLIKDAELWYVEAALYDFTFLEFIKIFLLLAVENYEAKHISFEPLMQSIYYDYHGKKRINVYKKRIIEKLSRGTKYWRYPKAQIIL